MLFYSHKIPFTSGNGWKFVKSGYSYPLFVGRAHAMLDKKGERTSLYFVCFCYTIAMGPLIESVGEIMHREILTAQQMGPAGNI